MMFDNRCNGEYQENIGETPYVNNMVGGKATMPGCICPPVMECPKENCIHRTIIHEVPHIQNINTKIINHHVYRHTYTPNYTMCEMDTCENVYEPMCNNF